MLPACGGERRGTIGRQVRGVLGEASDDPASARRNVTTQSALIRAADPQDVECLARAQRRHRPGHRARTDRGSGSAWRRGCGRRCFASGRRSAGTDRRDGAAARPRELGAIPLQTLQRFGASRLHASAVRHEIGSARGADGADLLGTWLLRFARRRGRRRRCADARLDARSSARGRRRIAGLRVFTRLRIRCRRRGSGRRRFASGRRSAASNRRDGAAAWSRELRAILLQTLQRFGASRLHAPTMRPEIRSACGADGADLLGTGILRFAWRRGRRGRRAHAPFDTRSSMRGRRGGRSLCGLCGFSRLRLRCRRRGRRTRQIRPLRGTTATTRRHSPSGKAGSPGSRA